MIWKVQFISMLLSDTASRVQSWTLCPKWACNVEWNTSYVLKLLLQTYVVAYCYYLPFYIICYDGFSFYDLIAELIAHQTFACNWDVNSTGYSSNIGLSLYLLFIISCTARPSLISYFKI